jgi:hypothetical protein
MTRKRAKVVSKSPMKSETMDVSAVMHEGLKDHPEVQLVLEIAAQARLLEQHAQPIEIDLTTDLTLTPRFSQIPGL